MTKRTFALAAVIGAVALLGLFHEDLADAMKGDDARLRVTAAFSEQCGLEHPLLVRLTNGADKPLRSVNLWVQVFSPGDSEDLVAAGSSFVEWTRIVEPRKQEEACFHVPLKRRVDAGLLSLKAQARPSSASFYRDGEFVPR